MSRYLLPLALFALLGSLAYDLVVWGAVPAIPVVGDHIQTSASRESFLAAGYIALGQHVDRLAPGLQAAGSAIFVSACEEGFARIGEDAGIAMDVIFGATWNGTHRWLKILYYAPLPLLVLCGVLWTRRPRKISLMGARR